MLDYQRESPNIFHDIPSKYIPISPWCCWSNLPFGDSPDFTKTCRPAQHGLLIEPTV
jgi:hypothetical protein